ncbi:MAG: hypothetical protein ACYCV4_02460 [Dermatophilaceae bacterium]
MSHTSRRQGRILSNHRRQSVGETLETYRGAELVESRGLVRHSCGHSVLWELLPGVPDDLMKGLSLYPCPCCGGETGRLAADRPNPEWPDHVLFAGLGLAHCHHEMVPCADVDRAHKLGQALKGRRN